MLDHRVVLFYFIFLKTSLYSLKWLYQFTFPTASGGSLFSIPSPSFIIGRLFDDGSSDQCEGDNLTVVLICIFLPHILWRNIYLGLVYIFDWVVRFSDTELYEIFIYFGC